MANDSTPRSQHTDRERPRKNHQAPCSTDHRRTPASACPNQAPLSGKQVLSCSRSSHCNGSDPKQGTNGQIIGLKAGQTLDLLDRKTGPGMGTVACSRVLIRLQKFAPKLKTLEHHEKNTVLSRLRRWDFDFGNAHAYFQAFT